MGDKLVNECLQTRTWDGKPEECNLTRVSSNSPATLLCYLCFSCNVVVFKQMYYFYIMRYCNQRLHFKKVFYYI